ncbi:MAG: cytochrome c [Candidatus Thiodiazotropha sp.]
MCEMNGRTLTAARNALALTLVLIAVYACSGDSHEHPKLVTGEQLFNYHCSSCHKKTGEGNFLKGIPASKDTYLTALQIAHKVKSGTSGKSKMPEFPNMSEAEAEKIAAYVKSMKP